MKKHWKKRLLSVAALLLAALFALGGCATVDESLLIDCTDKHTRFYAWKKPILQDFYDYPELWSYSVAEPPHLSFDSCRDFYKKIRRRNLSEEEVETLLQWEKYGGPTDGISLPALSAIREIRFDNKTIVTEVDWYSCADYVMRCTAVVNGMKRNFYVHHPGYRDDSLETAAYSAMVCESFTEDGIEYTRYTSQTNQTNGSRHDREVLCWAFSEGDYTYRVWEKTLTVIDANGESGVFYAMSCIEIAVDSEYFYVYLGQNETNKSPDLTKDVVDDFTLSSF